MKHWIKVASTLYSLLLFGILITASHEMFHQWGARWVGVPEGDKVIFGFASAHYYFPPNFIPSTFQDIAVSLAGGLGVAMAYFTGWVIRRLSERYTKWDLDDIFALQFVGLWQFLYAFSEIGGNAMLSKWGSGIAILISLVVVLLTYGKKMVAWLDEDNE